MNTYPSHPKEALEQLARLSVALSDPAARASALDELRLLAAEARGKPEGAPLRLAEIDAAVGGEREHLELLLLPSIFAPEDWAFTFLEGLLDVPADELAGKKMVEVGTGSGWIPIALSKFTGLAEIHGVDLNPHSRIVATCNAWLNCSPEQAARLRFGTSDLLVDLPAEERWDFVVGCIPQVLRADDLGGAPPEEEQALYDLSNYCAIQNVYEDHFGLGLIARLLDECPERLAPGGRLLLNLAGRPGRAIIERMFSRRGFRTSVLVARRVRQAADTDIRPLVTLEENTKREFEFYLEQHSPEPIRARTALGWLASGNPIWHEVAVWQAELALPRETLAVRRALREAGSGSLLGDLDLSDASQEQLDFVASLARRLAADPVIPYAHEAGDAAFRVSIARYLERFFGLRLGEGEIFVGPEREQTVYSLLLATCDPGDGVLITRNLRATYSRALEKAGVDAIVTNDTLREVKRLLGAFDVKVAILGVEPGERSNLSALREIADEAASRGILVIIDESAFFTITSGVEPRTLFEFLAREPHRPNLVVLYGLVKNAVYPDFELTLLLPVPERLHADLEIAAEATYSRISTPVQWFYEKTFADLLSFRISFEPPSPAPARAAPAVPLPRSARMEALAAFPAFAPKIFREDDPELIRLDYGENESAVPHPLVEGLLAACAAPRRDREHHGLREAVAAFLLETRGVAFESAEVAIAQGVWPLIHDLAVALRESLSRTPRILAVTPCYGVLPPTLLAAGCDVEYAPLSRVLEGRVDPPDALVISQPSNPSGSYLSREELVALASFAVRHRCRIFSDEIFGLVNLSHPAAEAVASPVSVERAVPGVTALTSILGGLSKEFAAGGLRVGWLASRDRELVSRVMASQLGGLPLASARAASHLYGAFARNPSGKLLHPERKRALRRHLDAMRAELAEKRALLASALPLDAGGDGGEAGGLFLAPLMTDWLGKRVGGVTLTPENLARLVYEHTHVVLNNGAWCSAPDRIRAVFSIPRAKLETAAARLAEFGKSLR
ncbi:aminotransferase class I/II-fold pyridoxal phosphate-dependent enzyme [Vulgatibacter incomptus]|uniref:Aspartate aminotransferase n=1 Tax=Vulgatibacter incomptus TaxID=1391653 RepID=A0A0K1P9B4_9BACT|nr:aminotransferase class I/II-fold pyridoxal phosphate-dependent enzyme [Vulgatibacter incomptus]AKU90011.1 Aspartate aminotransferase [Vulgatibacter incomptus]